METSHFILSAHSHCSTVLPERRRQVLINYKIDTYEVYYEPILYINTYLTSNKKWKSYYFDKKNLLFWYCTVYMCNVRDVCVIFYYFDILFCILFITSCKALVLIQISTILNRQRRIRPGIGIEVQVILKTWDTKKHYNYIGNKLKKYAVPRRWYRPRTDYGRLRRSENSSEDGKDFNSKTCVL